MVDQSVPLGCTITYCLQSRQYKANINPNILSQSPHAPGLSEENAAAEVQIAVVQSADADKQTLQRQGPIFLAYIHFLETGELPMANKEQESLVHSPSLIEFCTSQPKAVSLSLRHSPFKYV